jgi:putative transposase
MEDRWPYSGRRGERARRRVAGCHARRYRARACPKPTEEAPQHLCLDKGYDNEPSREVVRDRDYVAHIRRIGEEEKLDCDTGEKRYPPRRWVVERTLGWLSKCRAILVRYEKKGANYLGLIKVACTLLWYRRQHRLSLLR